MDAVDQFGLSRDQHLGAVLEVARVRGERLAPKLLFIELMGIDKRAHRAVQQHDPPGQNLLSWLRHSRIR